MSIVLGLLAARWEELYVAAALLLDNYRYTLQADSRNRVQDPEKHVQDPTLKRKPDKDPPRCHYTHSHYNIEKKFKMFICDILI